MGPVGGGGGGWGGGGGGRLAGKSADFCRAEHQVADAAGLLVQLALTLQPVPPRGAQVAILARQPVKTDIRHLLAGLGRATVFVEIRAGLSLGAPYLSKHFPGVIHLRVPSSRCCCPIDSNSSPLAAATSD